MQFNEDIAAKIAAEHNIDAKTIRVWKTRGKIPDRYLRAGFVRLQKLTPEDFSRQKKLLKILNMPEFRTTGFLSAGVTDVKIKDVRNQKTSFTTVDLSNLEGIFTELKAAISGILRDDRRFLDRFQMRILTLLSRKEIVLLKLIEDTGKMSREEYRAINYAISKKEPLISDLRLINKVVEALRALYVQLQ